VRAIILQETKKALRSWLAISLLGLLAVLWDIKYMPRYFIYCRKSSEAQDRQGEEIQDYGIEIP